MAKKHFYSYVLSQTTFYGVGLVSLVDDDGTRSAMLSEAAFIATVGRTLCTTTLVHCGLNCLGSHRLGYVNASSSFMARITQVLVSIVVYSILYTIYAKLGEQRFVMNTFLLQVITLFCSHNLNLLCYILKAASWLHFFPC